MSMDVKYMISKLSYAIEVGDDELVGRMVREVWPTLAAMLHAGQMLNDSLIIVAHQKRDSYREAIIPYNTMVVQAIDAWNAATKGG